jgi:hypothetical protein
MTRVREPFEEDAVPEELEAEEEQESGTRGLFWAGLAVGALVGAGIAVFLTSKRGRSATRRVRRDFEDLRDEARAEFARRRRELRKRMGRAAHHAREAVEDALS